MDSQLYIPKKIKVGFDKRSDTYNGLLAYVIYYDDKGVLRKEKSWEGWRDKKIEPQEFDNTPVDGFIINKSLKRYNWSHFSSNRTMIRIYDSRGFEFEITPENLIGILMNVDCLRRGFEGKFVYAWSGTDLVLLPAQSEEYEKATVYTELQAGKVKAKDMIPGCVYRTKKEQDLIFIGKLDWYENHFKKQPNPLSEDEWRKKNDPYYGRNYGSNYYTYPKTVDVPSREPRKQYIFVSADKDNKHYTHTASLEFLSKRTTDTAVSNFASLITKFEKDIHSQALKKNWIERVPDEEWKPNLTGDYYTRVFPYNDVHYVDCGDNCYRKVEFSYGYDAESKANGGEYQRRTISYSEPHRLDSATGREEDVKLVGVDKIPTRFISKDEIASNSMNLGYMYGELANGNKVKMSIYDL